MDKESSKKMKTSKIFKNIKIIEEFGNELGKSYEFTDHYQFNDPMSINDVEFFEDILKKQNTPYTLTQLETTNDDPPRYCKGYVIFTTLKETM
jgi:hypothetical protein